MNGKDTQKTTVQKKGEAPKKADSAQKALKVVEIELGKKAKLKRAATPKKTIEAVKSKAGSNKAAAATEVPAYLQPPSPSLLRSFRKAAEEKRKLARAVQKAKAKGEKFLAKPLKQGKKYSIDLRIHSPASIGYFSTGGVDPAPALVRLAKVKGIDTIAVTDFHDASFVDLVRSLASGTPVTIIPGVDIRCQVEDCREVYLTALFPETTTAVDIERILQVLEIPQEARGRRDFCLATPLKQILETVESNGGIVIPSRVDKTPYRQLAISTLIEKFGFHAFDVVHPENTEFFRERWPEGEFTFFTFSNANALAQIGSRVAKVRMTSPGFEGIKELVRRRPVVVERERRGFGKF